MKQAKILLLVLCILFIHNVFGQTTQNSDEQERLLRQREKREQEIRNKNGGYDKDGFIANRNKKPQPPPLYKGKASETNNLNKTFERTKHLIVVPQSYFKEYKFQLKDKNVNLARLQPDKNCYGKYTVTAEELERCSEIVPISGGGSLYSFRYGLNYALQTVLVYSEENIVLLNSRPDTGFDKEVNWWNIRFVNDKFVVQNNYVRGIISEIGDVDLTEINLASKELEFLDNFKQKKTLEEIKEQSDALKKTISFNNFIYSYSAPVKLKSTYVLRSTDYTSIEVAKLLPSSKFVDRRADMTIVFKVVGQEDDGSVIIL